jgi:hypothetical protein
VGDRSGGGGGWPLTGGGDRGDLWLVLDRGLAPGTGRDGPFGEPVGVDWGTRRVKNDERDAIDLIDMLRLGRLPEAWIAPPQTRELRELVRYRAKLVALRSGLKAQVHAVMAKEGVLPNVTDMFCAAGNVQLNEMQLGDAYTIRVESLRDLIGARLERRNSAAPLATPHENGHSALRRSAAARARLFKKIARLALVRARVGVVLGARVRCACSVRGRDCATDQIAMWGVVVRRSSVRCLLLQVGLGRV